MKPNYQSDKSIHNSSESSSFCSMIQIDKKSQLLKDKIKAQKNFQIKKLGSKIDWNLKYQFPKDPCPPPFEYSGHLSKIDLFNKHLEKKITSIEEKQMNLVKSLKHKELPFDYEINKLKVLPPLKHQFSMNGFDQLSDMKSLPIIDNLKPYPTSSIIESSPQMSFIQTLK